LPIEALGNFLERNSSASQRSGLQGDMERALETAAPTEHGIAGKDRIRAFVIWDHIEGWLPQVRARWNEFKLRRKQCLNTSSS